MRPKLRHVPINDLSSSQAAPAEAPKIERVNLHHVELPQEAEFPPPEEVAAVQASEQEKKEARKREVTTATLEPWP